MLLILKKRVTDILKTLLHKNKINEASYNELRPAGLKLWTFYGSAKVHKSVKNGLPPFGSILSAIDTSANKLAKFLVLILSDVTENESKVEYSFSVVVKP